MLAWVILLKEKTCENGSILVFAVYLDYVRTARFTTELVNAPSSL